jgi:hypothetical protein
MGHSDIETTLKYYVGLDEKDNVEMLGKLGTLFQVGTKRGQMR